MKRTAQLSIIAIVLVTVSSCANLFQGNLFENFDGPPDASDILDDYVDGNGNVSTADAPDFVNDVADAAESSRFYDDLSGSDRTKLNTALKSVYENNSVATTVRQEASILAAEVVIRGTDAGETINNVANVLTSDGGGDSFNDPTALMDLVIPDSAKGNPAAIEAILDDLVTAADAYDALGSSLTDTDGDGTVDGPSGANMTEIAQKAAVAMAIQKLVADPAIGSTSALAADISAGSVTSTALDNFPGDTASAENILAAGGLGGVFGS